MKNAPFTLWVALASGVAWAQPGGIPPAQADPFPVGPDPALNAPPPAPNPLGPPVVGAKQWRWALLGTGGLLFDNSASAVVGGVAAEAYLQPLVDRPHVALGLLTFLEHPDTLSFSLGNAVNGAQGAVGASVYPWDNVGLSASLGLELQPSNNLQYAHGSLLMQEYFQPNLKGSLGYAGARTWQPTQYASLDGVHGSLSWLWGVALLALSIDVGFQQQKAPDPGAAIAGSLWRQGQLSVSYFLGRRWTASLFTGVSYLSYNAAGSNAGAEWVGASLECYLTDSFYVIAGVEPTFHQFSGVSFTPTANFAQTDSTLQTVWVTAAYRL